MSLAYPLVGGLMLGSSVYHLLYFNGNVLGISGIYSSTVNQILNKAGLVQSAQTVTSNGTESAKSNGRGPRRRKSDSNSKGWKFAFTAGLISSGFLLRTFRSSIEKGLSTQIFENRLFGSMGENPLKTFVVGALVGIGTKLAGGCTSGHMLCGISRLSPRSVVATVTFFSVAVGVTQLSQVSLHPTQWNHSLPDSHALSTLIALQIPFLLYRYVIPKAVPKQFYKSISSFAIAAHFTFGLALAGMLQPSKILNFLALPGSPTFDPSLAFVAIGGLLPNLVAWIKYVRDTAKPVHSDAMELPQNSNIDWRLIIGSAIFGLGWGLLGICPGPGIVVQGAFMDQWKSIGTWVLGVTVGGLLTP